MAIFVLTMTTTMTRPITLPLAYAHGVTIIIPSACAFLRPDDKYWLLALTSFVSFVNAMMSKLTSLVTFDIM